MAINNQKAVIGSEYLAYGGINQVWQCNSSSTATTKTIINDPGDIGISDPCIFVQFLNGHNSASSVLTLNALGHTGAIYTRIQNNTYIGWGAMYSLIDANVVVCLQWDSPSWKVVGNPIVHSKAQSLSDMESQAFCYANRFKQVFINAFKNTSGATRYPYGITFEDVHQMAVIASLLGQAPNPAVVTSYETTACTVDFAYGLSSSAKKGFIQVMGY